MTKALSSMDAYCRGTKGKLIACKAKWHPQVEKLIEPCRSFATHFFVRDVQKAALLRQRDLRERGRLDLWMDFKDYFGGVLPPAGHKSMISIWHFHRRGIKHDFNLVLQWRDIKHGIGQSMA